MSVRRTRRNRRVAAADAAMRSITIAILTAVRMGDYNRGADTRQVRDVSTRQIREGAHASTARLDNFGAIKGNSSMIFAWVLLGA